MVFPVNNSAPVTITRTKPTEKAAPDNSWAEPVIGAASA